MLKNNTLTVFLLLLSFQGFSQNPSQLPLFQMDWLQYQGAFRLPATTYGPSNLNFSEGPIEYNPDNHSLFIVSHSHEQAIAEFEIPALVQSDSLQDLNMSGPPLQIFKLVLDSTPDGNPQNIDRIGGMEYVQHGNQLSLVVNGYEYYDAPGDNSLTSLIIRDANDLEHSPIEGYLQFEGGAGHTSGWISPIPAEWQDSLGGTYMTGQSSGRPIISRFSVGPSAFAFDMNEMLTDTSGQIETTKLLDFSLQNRLAEDLHNDSLQNDLWTHKSRATFGFVIPGTRTYMTFGHTAGIRSGICYKCTQNNGNLCGGYCPPDSADYDQYYWLWDLADLLQVKAGTMESYEVRPYDYGILTTPFQNSVKEIGGGSYDPQSNTLYMAIQKADREQGTYANPPVILAYTIDIASDIALDLPQRHIKAYPNPTTGMLRLKGAETGDQLQLFDLMGRVVHTFAMNTQDQTLDVQHLPSGLYLLTVQNNNGQLIHQEKIWKQ